MVIETGEEVIRKMGDSIEEVGVNGAIEGIEVK